MAVSQEAASLLWRIESPDGRSGYLYGTIHSRDSQAYTYAGAVKSLMPAVRTVAGELDPEEAAGAALAMMSAMMLPQGQQLTDLFERKKDRLFVENAIQERIGPLSGMFMRMKPFFVMAAMMENDIGDDHPVILDDHLLSSAHDQGNRVIGLETVQEQFDAIDATPPSEQARMLLAYLRDPGQRGDMEQMLAAYVAQDLERLVAIGESAGGLPDGMERALIGDRNQVMAHRMDSILRADTTALFLIGALHLPGPDGALALLRGLGYQVEAGSLHKEADPPPPFGPPLLLGAGIRFVSADPGFSIDMYGAPDAEHTTDGWTFTSMKDGNAVVVMAERDTVHHMDLDQRINEDLLSGSGVEPVPVFVQGVEGRRVEFTDEGRELEFLFMVHDARLWVIVVGDPEEAVRDRIIRSFRFTGLPDHE